MHLTHNMDIGIYFKNIEIQMSEITAIIKKIGNENNILNNNTVTVSTSV